MSQYALLYVPPGTSTWSVVAPGGTHSRPYTECAVRATVTGTLTSSHAVRAAPAVPGARTNPAASRTTATIRRTRNGPTDKASNSVSGNRRHQHPAGVGGGGELDAHGLARHGHQPPP